MTQKYQPRITEAADGTCYAFIVRIDNDGQEYVLRGYEGRHFANRKNAERSTGNYINKFCK